MIAADLPIGLVSQDAIARGDGAPEGRETEIAGLLSFIKHRGVQNIVWLTADMHYTAAHHYSPNRAVFQDFDPFWEFVSGPLHAGTWGPAPLDNTFGPEVRYQNGCTAEQGENLAPCFGLQFFGRVDIEGDGVMTVTLKDVGDQDLWSVRIDPAGDERSATRFAQRRLNELAIVWIRRALMRTASLRGARRRIAIQTAPEAECVTFARFARARIASLRRNDAE